MTNLQIDAGLSIDSGLPPAIASGPAAWTGCDSSGSLRDPINFYGASSSLSTPPPLPAAADALGGSKLRIDFNRDGQMDLLLRDYTTGRNTVWLMNGAAYRATVELMAVPDVNWRIQGADDFNRDGETDILWQNSATGAVVLWLMNGTARLYDAWLPSVPDLNWQIQGTGDLNGDGHSDILWRNAALGSNGVWLMNGTNFIRSENLPDALGANLKMQGTGDFNGDGRTDILWRNYLSGSATVWLMNGTNRLGIQSLSYQVTDLNWQIQAIDDFNRDGRPDLIWRHAVSGSKYVWLMNGTTVTSGLELAPVTVGTPITSPTPSISNPGLVWNGVLGLSNLVFSGNEGAAGTFQVQLSQAPTSAVTMSLVTGSWLTVDADGLVQNGTQSTLTFTPENWNQPRTVWFMAENDDSSSDRASNTISYSLSGGWVGNGLLDLGNVVNTYAPDSSRFNIDLDFRNDYEGFWTPARQAIARQAANDWANRIANEWTGLTLNNSLKRLDTAGDRTYSFTSRRYVDDLVVFVNDYSSSAAANEPALGGPDYEFGGWISTPNQLMPRVGQIALNSTIMAGQPDLILYQVVAHEIGHTLGLLGLNWTGYSLTDQSNPQTATFRGDYSRLANGGNYVALQSQDGGDFAHPSSSVRSIMSYGWIYNPETTRPTAVDYAMLADSGYRITGINA
jgi:hypothetical protein